MRPNSLQSAIAPVQNYTCLFCRSRNTRRLYPASRRYQYTESPVQHGEQSNFVEDGQKATPVSHPLVVDGGRGGSSSHVAVDSTEAAAQEGKNAELRKQYTVNNANNRSSKQEPRFPSAVDRKERRVDLGTRHRKTLPSTARRRSSRRMLRRIVNRDSRMEDVSLEDVAQGAAVPEQGLQTLHGKLHAVRENAAETPSAQGIVEKFRALNSSLEDAPAEAKARSDNRIPPMDEKASPATKSDTAAEESVNKATKKTSKKLTKKASKKAAKKVEKTAAKGPDADSKKSKKERKAKLGDVIKAKVDVLRTNLGDAQQKDQEIRKVKSQKKGTRKISIAVKPRKVHAKNKAQSVDAPRTAGLRKDTPSDIQTASATKLRITPIDVKQPPVPSLAYGLERVLFNPGVYQLQDPRSRVYNFDPYLQKIMPIADFDFNALKEYITSSKDESLQQIAKQQGKRYVGSTSSMTGVLAHFHFLLSQWRSVNISMLSRSFPEKSLLSFTEFQRTPAAIFLRWKDGSYAIDADKQFDSSNVLSMLGKSMEKLLTLKTEDFERYRRSNPEAVTEEESNSPESYHYSTLGDFLMRSQLDAHDSRLPGTGMFDLKTRAVVSIRMDVANYEQGTGYEIKNRQGEWESYEREYYDMIRAAFLKYSMQVRMGRMDGIFVAFHNVERIFGFQYISLPEMDSTIHGQWDTSIGDQEFTLSLDLLNKILDRATKKFPKTSIRLHFETRDAATPFMYVFAEPVTEEQIAEIQSAQQAKVEEFERTVLGRGLSQDNGPEWKDIQAEVEKAMDKDELALDDTEDPDKSRDEMDDAEMIDHNALHADVSGVGGADDIGIVANQEGEDPEDDDETDDGAEDEEEQDEEEEETEDDAEDVEDENEEDEAVQDESEEVDPVAEEGESGKEDDGHRPELVTLTEESPATPEQGSADSVENIEMDALSSDEPILSDSADATQNMSQHNEPEEPTATSTPSNPPTTESPAPDPFESNTSSDDFATEADQSFLDDLSADSNPDSEASADDILAMTLTLRNKVNGQYVLRPTDMTAKDKWEIEYSLVEVPVQSRAQALYQACQVRRQKKYTSEVVPDGQEEVISGYVRRLREMSAQGKAWRAKVDESDKEGGKTAKVLGKDPGDVA